MSNNLVQQQMGFRRWITVLTLAAVFVILQGVPDARAQEPPPPGAGS
jgi:hypothetical protein